MTETILFYLFAILCTVSALLMITRRNPLYAALWLVACFLGLAGLYAMLDAKFVALLQVLVYAGAIMMLIIFVIMTVNLSSEELRKEKRPGIGFVISGAVVLFCLVQINDLFLKLGRTWPLAQDNGLGTIENLGLALFTRHVLAFEIISLVLLAALVGVVMLAKKIKTGIPIAGTGEK